MATVIIGKNQTGGALQVNDLPIPDNQLPASPGTVTLTDYATVNEIQDSVDLRTHVDAGDAIINLDGSDLSQAESQNALTSVSSPSDPTMADIDNVDSITVNNSGEIRTGVTAADTLLLRAYDVDGVSYVTFATLTANNTPTMSLASDVTGTTQAPNDNSTKLATTAYADAAGGGGGNVSNTGTPVNNQLAVWTDATTIEGDASLTFDTTTDTLAVAASGKFAFGAVTILDDTAGSTTLSNIDVLDATTESTIEAAIDTLANLTAASSLATVGTITSGTWEGTDVGVAHGGTGLSTFGGTNTILYTTAADTLSSIATGNDSLLVTGATGIPSISTAIPDGVTATTQSPNDNSTKVATTAYVDAAVDTADTLSEVLANGNTTGANDIVVSNGQAIQTATSAGNTLLLQAYDTDLVGYVTFATLTANNTPAMDLSTSVTMGTNEIYYATGTDVPVADGGTGLSTFGGSNTILFTTAADTLSSDTNLTWDGTNFNIATAKNFQIAGVTILADATGTTTLSAIDALDATTESTIEAAIDTLANLTSASSLATVGTIGTGTWQADTIAVSYGGTGATTFASNAILTGDGTNPIVAEGNLLFDGSDLTLYEAVNDGNPSVSVGSVGTETLVMQSVYDGGAQTLDKVTFTTKAASVTADKGLMEFYVDEVLIVTIDDDALNLASGKEYEINGTSVLSSTALGTGVTSSSLTSVGTIGTGTWEATDVGVLHGGTGASDEGTARTNLGVAIGSDVQAYDATLTSIALLGTTADRVAYTTDIDTWAETPLTAFGRSIIDDADEATFKATVNLEIGTDVQAYSDALGNSEPLLNGAFLQSPVVDVLSDGATVTLEIDQAAAADLQVQFSETTYTLDTDPTPLSIALTAGSDISPTLNYVYVDYNGGSPILGKSTTAWPATSHAPIATVMVQSAGSVQTDGPYKMHAWIDHIANTVSGHMQHLNFWIRQQHASWVSGVSPTITITPNGGAADNVDIATTAGVVLQLHDHTYPAFDTGVADKVYVINDSVTPYTTTTDLNTLLTDAQGASMSASYFSLVFWGIVNEDTGDCKLMVNLPNGSYNSSGDATLDTNKYNVYNIPAEYAGTGFLIARQTLRHQTASSGTWTDVELEDLRGITPGGTAGTGSAQANEFADNVFAIFDDGDPTRKIAFQASGITTATTVTLTVPDASGTLLIGDDIGTSVQAYDADLGTIAGLAHVGGEVIYSNAGTWAAAAPGVTSGVQAYDADLDGISTLSSTGMVTRTGAGTYEVRTITGTANEITVTNGSGVAGNPTLSLPADISGFDTILMNNGGALQAGTGVGNTLLLQAYDTDTGPAYVTFATLTSGTDPSMDLSTAVTIGGSAIAYTGGAFHNGFSDYVGNEHVDHTSVTLTAGEGLTGGGDISTNRSFALDFSDLGTTDTAIGAADLISIHDGAQKKITWANATESISFTGDVSGTPGATTVTDLTITSEAQGDILYFNGTNWVRLEPGLSGHFLKTQGAAANPLWAAPAGGGDVVGPSPTATVDNTIVRWNGTSGTAIQECGIVVDDSDNIIMPTGTALQTSKLAGNTLLLQAYDVDGVAYTTFATLTANNTPTMALSGDVTGVTQSADDNSTKLATTAYADAAGGGSTEQFGYAPSDGMRYIGTRTVTQINALVTPKLGLVVVAGDAGTPSASGSELLALGDIAEYTGDGWKKIVAHSGNFPPIGTRLCIDDGTLYSPLTDASDEAKIADFDGTSRTPATKTTPVELEMINVRNSSSVFYDHTWSFEGEVPTGEWENHSHESYVATHTPTGTTVTMNLANGRFHTIDLDSATGDVTISLINGSNGVTYGIRFIQDRTGGTARNVIWPDGTGSTPEVLWPSGIAPIITTTLTSGGSVDYIQLHCVTDSPVGEEVYYGLFAQDYQ